MIEVPQCLRRMSPESVRLLRADLADWGSAVLGLGKEQVKIKTGLGAKRAERLHAWAVHHGVNVMPGEPTSEIVNVEDLELADPKAERPADPALDVRQRDPDCLEVNAGGNSLHGGGMVRNLEELFREGNIDPDVWTADDFQVRTWSTPMRRRRTSPSGARLDDEVLTVRSWYTSAKLRRRLDRVTSAADFTARLPRKPSRMTSALALCVVLPDMQVGYRWADNHRKLIPLHDWDAIAAALELIKILQPQMVQDIGDGLDNAAFSEKFKAALELRDTARPSALSRHGILRRIREIVPGAEIDVQGGNHEERTERPIVGTELDGLKTADRPDGPPILSFANILGLDSLDITWRNYGEHRFLWDTVMVEHGSKVKARGGLTAADIIRDSMHSVVFGHIHRREQASRTIHTPGGPRVITASTAGCLCRIDGAVPGVTKRPDWQQGLELIWFDETNQQDHHQIIPIERGVLYYNGRRIEGNGAHLAAEIAAQIDWPQIAAGWGPHG